MTNFVANVLQFNDIRELKTFFNNTLFLDIQFSKEKQTLMIESSHVENITTRFWRLLETQRLLLAEDFSNKEYERADFYLEIFLNNCMSCYDALALSISYFLNINERTAFHNKKFILKLKDELTSKLVENDTLIQQIDEIHCWIVNKLYPYRNIVHHVGQISKTIRIPMSEEELESLRLFASNKRTSKPTIDISGAKPCVPKPDCWDFKDIHRELKKRKISSHTAFLIVTNNLKLPNILSGDIGDGDKYYPIEMFFDDWIQKICLDLIKIITIIVAYQHKI